MYYHKIMFKKKQKYNYTQFQNILPYKLNVIKCFLDSYLAKRFIQKISDFYSFLILFVKKLDRRIRLCINY